MHNLSMWRSLCYQKGGKREKRKENFLEQYHLIWMREFPSHQSREILLGHQCVSSSIWLSAISAHHFLAELWMVWALGWIYYSENKAASREGLVMTRMTGKPPKQEWAAAVSWFLTERKCKPLRATCFQSWVTFGPLGDYSWLGVSIGIYLWE
jgi:hypothetical protein